MVPAAQTLAEIHPVGIRQQNVHQDDIKALPGVAEGIAARLGADHLKILLTLQEIAGGVPDHRVVLHQ